MNVLRFWVVFGGAVTVLLCLGLAAWGDPPPRDPRPRLPPD